MIERPSTFVFSRFLVGAVMVIIAALGLAVVAGGGGASAEPPGFVAENVITGLSRPTNIEFSPDGRVFIAEQSGLLKVFSDVDDNTPTTVADLRDATHSVDGRGLLGLALDPDFPNTPHVYVMYAHDAPIGGTAPTFGNPGSSNDECPSPPGPGKCVISGRISRLVLSGDVAVSEAVILEDWCQEWTSHSIGDLRFGPDGALYASSGEGAFAGQPDWGQRSGENGCDDPPIPHGGTGQLALTGEGGALRSQDLRTPGDPAGLSGTVIRIDKNTGLAHPANPNFGHSDPNVARVIGYGFRNPYRTAFRPGTDELWIGDVGWNSWEEINLIDDADNEVPNFGWPCMEGPDLGYDIGSQICTDLLAEGPSAVRAPQYAYEQTVEIVPNSACLSNNGSPSALTFYQFGQYPAEYDGAFFFGDYSRRCTWAMLAGPDGRPDPSTARVMLEDIAVTDLERGPNGDIYALNVFGGGALGGTLVRLSYPSGSLIPTAQITSDVTSGPLPLAVQFDASASIPGQPGDTLTYDWDFDGDGNFGEATGVMPPPHAYAVEGRFTAQVRVTDQDGKSDVASLAIFAGDPPVITITSPAPSTEWAVDDELIFAGSAVDGSGTPIAATELVWDLILHHCETLTDCHTHTIGTVEDVTSGTFFAPEHEYPSFIEVALTATAASGLEASGSVELFPQTAILTLAGTPDGVEAGFNGQSVSTPSDHEVIVGTDNTLSAASRQILGATAFDFLAWSDGGAQTHDVTVTANQTVTVQYAETTDPTLYLSSTSGGTVDGITFADEDVLSIDSATGVWSMVFDGSDVGLGPTDVDAVNVVSLDPLVLDLSLQSSKSISGLGSVDDSDVLRFTGVGGADTDGTFERLIDGSDIGYSSSGEDIDAVSGFGSDIVFSTEGGYNVPGAAGADEDALLFTPTALGNDTDGSSVLLFDGSDVGLASRDLTGVWVNPENGDLYGATNSTFTVGGFSGDRNDVFLFQGMFGNATSGTGSLVWDGAQFGYGNEQIDALHVYIAPTVLPGIADLMVAIDGDIAQAAVGDIVTFTVDVTNNGPDAAGPVTAEVLMPAGLTATATSGCTGDPLGLPCELAPLPSAGVAQFTVSAVVDQAASGNLETSVAVGGLVADPSQINNSASTSTAVITAPVPVDDGPADASIAGDPFHIAIGATMAVADGSAEDLLNNDDLGEPVGAIVSFGGGDLGGAVSDNLAGETVTIGAAGSLLVESNGAFTFTPDTEFEGPITFQYRVGNLAGDGNATVTVYVGERPAPLNNLIVLSSTSSGSAGGVSFADEDVVGYNTGTGLWSMIFDGSDVGVGSSDVDAVHLVSLDPLIIDLSFQVSRTIPGLGVVDDSDIVRFTGVAGATTSGSFEVLIDASDVDLKSGGEDIDAFTFDGLDAVFSTSGLVKVPGVVGADEDAVRLTPTSLGPNTAGSSVLMFDGSDVELGARDLTGIWVDPLTGDIYGAAHGNHTVGGLSGDQDDVFVFSGTYGDDTSGTATRFFDGDLSGFKNEQIDGLSIFAIS